MSSVQVRVGYAREIELGITGTFEQRCRWIRQNVFFHDWQWIEQYDAHYYIEWKSDDEKNQIVFVNKTDTFYLVTFLENNDELWADVMIHLNKETKEEFFFAFVYYDGGTYFEECFTSKVLELNKEN